MAVETHSYNLGKRLQTALMGMSLLAVSYCVVSSCVLLSEISKSFASQISLSILSASQGLLGLLLILGVSLSSPWARQQT